MAGRRHHLDAGRWQRSDPAAIPSSWRRHRTLIGSGGERDCQSTTIHRSGGRRRQEAIPCVGGAEPVRGGGRGPYAPLSSFASRGADFREDGGRLTDPRRPRGTRRGPSFEHRPDRPPHRGPRLPRAASPRQCRQPLVRASERSGVAFRIPSVSRTWDARPAASRRSIRRRSATDPWSTNRSPGIPITRTATSR